LHPGKFSTRAASVYTLAVRGAQLLMPVQVQIREEHHALSRSTRCARQTYFLRCPTYSLRVAERTRRVTETFASRENARNTAPAM
jgi:hypothetical protein